LADPIFQDTITLGSLIQILSGIVFWGATVATIIIWLNKKFESLVHRSEYDRYVDNLSTQRLEFINLYERRHTALMNRIYDLELWAARKNGPNGYSRNKEKETIGPTIERLETITSKPRKK
jgi:hypothetical protein